MNKRGLLQWILVAAPAVLAIGVMTVFRACSAKEDGTWMHCHLAGQIVKGLAALLTLLSLGTTLSPKKALARVCAAALVPIAVLTALVPGTIVSMCMPGMRCQTTTRPGALVLCVLIAVAALVAFACTFIKERRAIRR